MDFRLNDDEQALQRSFREFLRREWSRKRVRELDDKGEFPYQLFRDMGQLGYMGLPFSEKYGGAGQDVVKMGLILQELGYSFTAMGNKYLSAVAICGRMIEAFGSEQQRNEILPRIISGELMVTFSVTEPGGASDSAAMVTEASLHGDTWVVNGHKIFASGAGEAGLIFLAARTDKDAPRHQGISILLVDPADPGIQMRRIPTLGLRTSPTYEVWLSDVRVPAAQMLGEAGAGWRYLRSCFEIERFGLACICVGGAQATIDDAMAYAQDRVVGGQPISKYQALQHMLADMQLSADAAWLLTYRAGHAMRKGESAVREACMAKLFASETFTRCALQGIQILGGYGYTMEMDMQRYLRDAKLYEIGGGTSQIQRNLIARSMGLSTSRGATG